MGIIDTMRRALGFFATGQFAVRKKNLTEPNLTNQTLFDLTQPNLTETNPFVLQRTVIRRKMRARIDTTRIHNQYPIVMWDIHAVEKICFFQFKGMLFPAKSIEKL